MCPEAGMVLFMAIYYWVSLIQHTNVHSWLKQCFAWFFLEYLFFCEQNLKWTKKSDKKAFSLQNCLEAAQYSFVIFIKQPFDLLIFTLISENQGLEKSRSASNFRKVSGPANLDFFLGLHLEKKLDLYHIPEKNPGDKLKKNLGLQDLNFF